MVEKIKNKKKLIGWTTVALLVVGMLISYTLLPEKESGFGTITVSAGPANLSPGEGGILEVFIIDHANRPASYNTNISETDPYVLGWANATGFNIQIPYNTPFDIVVWCRANKTQAYDTAWNLSLIRCNITSVDLGIATLTGMSEELIGSNSTYVWVNYWIDNGGTGYQINRGETVSIDEIRFEYYG